MKQNIILTAMLFISATTLMAQNNSGTGNGYAGTLSIGTRNSVSMFSHHAGTGIGIGGQTRIQVSDRINTEWFFDYIPSKYKALTNRNDYHVGWSVMYYPGNTVDFSNLLQPYFVVGHCFDYARVSAQNNRNNYAEQWTMATQAGLGTHINITEFLDCSLTSQYMLHFGKEIETTLVKENVAIVKNSHSGVSGHLLFNISFNYKLYHLW